MNLIEKLLYIITSIPESHLIVYYNDPCDFRLAIRFTKIESDYGLIIRLKCLKFGEVRFWLKPEEVDDNEVYLRVYNQVRSLLLTNNAKESEDGCTFIWEEHHTIEDAFENAYSALQKNNSD